ncbi:MAG: type II toxin-antitoxin system VapC family toxin [Chloroflexi bacterium]|nr:type II toxin-antitoxin system VapC family toxin [Chloroflexota bacterium]
MSAYLLDTNILILALRRQESALNLLGSFHQENAQLFISSITRSEIRAGMHPHEATRTDLLLDSFITLSVDARIADLAGTWVYEYARRGIQLTIPDAIIAATAHLYDLTLVTTNQKHFPMPEVRCQPFAPFS